MNKFEFAKSELRSVKYAHNRFVAGDVKPIVPVRYIEGFLKEGHTNFTLPKYILTFYAEFMRKRTPEQKRKAAKRALKNNVLR